MAMTDPTDLIAPPGLHFGPLGANWVHLCVDMQRMFAEQTDWHAPWMQRVLPEGRFVRLENGHRIFDTFFRVKDVHAIVHPMSGIKPSYYGIYEDNDPSKRLMVVANFDNDIPEYWEWSGEGLFPFDASNEA